MERRTLGRSGLKVSVLGLGTGQFGSFGQSPEDECVRIVHCALDRGINLVDTADFYSFGESERIVGKAIAGRRDKLVLATKCGMPMSDDTNERGGSRCWIMKSVEGSLQRLGVDYIDLYQLHAPDPDSDVEETLDAMNDLIRQGKVRYFGTSNSSAVHVTSSALRARLRNLNAPYSEQQSYSIFRRSPEVEVLPACETYGVGVLAYSPLDGGWLSGKYRKEQAAPKSPRQRLQPSKFDTELQVNQSKLEKVEALVRVAQDAGLDLSHMGVAFVLSHPAVSCALIGGAKVSYTEHYLAGQDVRLSDAVLDQIDAIVSPGANLPPDRPEIIDKTKRRRREGVLADRSASMDYIRRLVNSETAR